MLGFNDSPASCAVPGRNGVRDGRSWQDAIEPLLRAPDDRLWREHSDAVNLALLARWLPVGACRRALKTDLFDEAMGEGLYPLLAEHASEVTAADAALSVASAALARYPALLAAVADVRELPFASESFEVVVSNSTLDHFESARDVVRALGELRRVLRPGGRLLLTMDNLANPLVAIRNALPFALLQRLRLVPYPMGATFGPWRLKRILRTGGFEVLDTAAVMHCPRVFAVWRARSVERQAGAGSRQRLLRRLGRWESLGTLPTRFLTGYFVGVNARKL